MLFAASSLFLAAIILSNGSQLLAHNPVEYSEPIPAVEDVFSQLNMRPTPTSPFAEDNYDIDIDSGFLPPDQPLCRLVGAPWNIWEETWEETSGFRPGIGEDDDQHIRAWRQYIRGEMPVIDVKPLQDRVIELRRAHSLLAFLTHTYVHSEARKVVLQKGHQVIVPRALAIPFCAVSEMLNIPPILTYADTVLYNWRLKVPDLGFTVDNVEILSTFTRSISESHFFKTSLLIETIGPLCLRLMRVSLDEAIIGDETSIQRISDHLGALVINIKRITSFLNNVRTACNPHTFYWEIRPWFNGGKWIMEGVPASPGPWRLSEFGGPSAGQSTLIHSLDVFLGVDHSPRPGEKSKEETFMNQMASYMPHSHRKFLQDLYPYTDKIRNLVVSAGSESLLATRYNSAILALKELRTSHSQIAVLYIISQSQIEPPKGSAFVGEWEDKMVAKRNAKQEHSHTGSQTVHTGTGGTDLTKFLKRCRERTKEALV
ncbi:Indoleamine 2,3-dioxygenase [Melampsora americana]|nr:Indoleamine 2,3-dioxygenase [Melampsora americana]